MIHYTGRQAALWYIDIVKTPRTQLRYRQIHLDFHTSPLIGGIGTQFDPGEWQERLLEAAVDSVTLFAKCHHGYSYHPTQVGEKHPHLNFDLLRAQYEATKAVGINAPIYISAGVDNFASKQHPEWREIDKDGRYSGWAQSSLDAGFHLLDFHSPYLKYLCRQIEEVVSLFPDCDGIFLDIISQNESCGPWSLQFMEESGLDPRIEADRKESSRRALEKYYRATTAAARSLRASMQVFHNAGHIPRGRREILEFFSHLELESLPTGGWGYDHFPMSAKYATNLGLDFLGMTGKFHTTWGEFGGYKHPNALRYECSAMLAFGAKCSVGDQLHPNGRLDPSTYRLIGGAYREVAEKEPWCEGATQVFDLGVLSSEAELRNGERDNSSDEGACRILLEGHFLFGLVDREMDFSKYKALILPDNIRIDAELKTKVDAYLAGGGKLILSGISGHWQDGEGLAFDIGAVDEGPSPFFPRESEPQRGHDYILPVEGLRADFVDQPLIMYDRSRRIRVTDGESLGEVYDPYFNRDWNHFCSHQHAPNRPEPSGYSCGVLKDQILYFSHPVFQHYRQYGAVAYREFVVRAIRRLMGESLTLETNLPSTARVSLTHQEGQERYILHLLYAPTVARGGQVMLSGGNAAGGQVVEVIEGLPPLLDTHVRLRGLPTLGSVEPFDKALEVSSGQASGLLEIQVAAFSCHAMLAIS